MGERRYINKSFVTLFYENVEEGNLSYVSSINGYNFMKQNKEYIVLLNKANNVDYSDELYVYHNVLYFILNLCAKFSLKSQPSIYGKYGKWIL